MGLRQTYHNMEAAGQVKPDPAQSALIDQLANLSRQLVKAARATPPGLFARLLGKEAPPPPKGLYIWGEVGRGKTFAMDLFYSCITQLPKHRIHFHGFMQDVHAKRASTKSKNVIANIADEISSRARLLCLDEMQISDIADAMIIGRLFEALVARSVTIVTTSNLPPNGLYQDGLNRQLFLPFIDWMNESFDVVHLGNGLDYRLGRLASRSTYLQGSADKEMDDIWAELTDGSSGEPISIDVLGRKLLVPHAAHGCGRFTFAELCENPLGAPDYLALARNFKIIFIDHAPIIKPSQRNEAKRFILMIDTFYDARTKLIMSAAAPPEKLYPAGPDAKEFARTISRLKEMQSASWWKTTENDLRTSPISA